MFLKLPQIFNAFSKKERLIFITALLVFIVGFIGLTVSFIQANTILAPVDNGDYIEGLVGQPIFINPIFSDSNSPDSDISRLVFASIKNLVETYSVSDDHRVFNVRIKSGMVWQDKQPLTTDDIIFTVKAVQDPDTNSPLYPSWKGIKIERTSELEIKITLPHPYAFFENTLLGLKPIPKHIFADIPFAHLKLSNYNMEPIGSGPFQFTGYEKRRDGFITALYLSRSDSYPDAKPHLDKFSFKFYTNEDNLIKAFNSGEINGFSLSDPKKLPEVYIPKQILKLKMPQYYAVFFDPQNNEILKDPVVRAALNYSTDKKRIAETVFGDQAEIIDGPILFDQNGAQAGDFSIDNANNILDEAGWSLNENGVREIKEKLSSKKLEFGLTVYPAPFLIETAKIIKDDWAKAGIKINLNIPDPTDFENNIIKPRNYEMLLFGNIYGQNLDPFSFWHSSQKFHPGLNLSLYENGTADSLIESIRTDFNPEKQRQELEKLQLVIQSDQPAVFLYSPYYIYISSKSLHGFNTNYISLPSDRFQNIKDWYVKTVRVFKN